MNFKQWLLKEDTASQVKAICSQMDLQKDSTERLQDALFVLADLAQQAGNDTKAHDIMHARAVLPIVREKRINVLSLYDNLITNGKQLGFLSFFDMQNIHNPYTILDVYPPAYDAKLFGIGYPVEQIHISLALSFKKEVVQQAIDAQQGVADFLGSRNITLDMLNFDNAEILSADVTTDTGSTSQIQDHGFIKSQKFADYIKQSPWHQSPRSVKFLQRSGFSGNNVVMSDLEYEGYRPTRLLQIEAPPEAGEQS